MSDDDSPGVFGRLRAALAPTQDQSADPQARDEDPIAVSRTERTEEPDRDEELWLSEAAIIGGQYDRDFRDLLEDALLDLRGRRGTALIEHAYDDPEEREYILALRLFRVETTTAYTRSGKAILLRPDDDPDLSETVAIQDFDGDRFYDESPETPAGKTAAFVQFDDIFGNYKERDDIPFALDDVTLLTNDPDTGSIFGRPDTASVADRSEQLREEFDDTAQAIKAVGYGHWIASVDTDDQDTAKDLLKSFDPSDPERINVTNYAVDAERFDGQVPDNVEHIQQQIEYVLAGLPTPLYRVGFAGDINRDVTSVQQDDYREEISRARDRLEAAFHDLLAQKAREFLFGDAKSDQELPVEVALEIRPEESDSPLKDEQFDADEFASMMQGLKAAAPGGAVEQVVPPHELRETFLGLEAEPPEAPTDDTGAVAPLPDEADEEVQAAFRDAYLGNRYRAGDDMVDTPDGVGLVVEAITSSRENEDAGDGIPEQVEASTDSPTYVVAVPTSDPPIGLYKASELSMADLDADVDPLGSLADDEEAAPALAACGCDDEQAQLGDWNPPESWRESDIPARVIALDAFSSMGGDFDGCKREMSGEVGRPANFCGAFIDWVFGGYDYWRGDSFLPGD